MVAVRTRILSYDFIPFLPYSVLWLEPAFQPHAFGLLEDANIGRFEDNKTSAEKLMVWGLVP